MDGFLRFSVLVRNPVINPAYLVARMWADNANLTAIYATAYGGPGSLFKLDPEPKFEPKAPISADAKTMRRKAYELEQLADQLRDGGMRHQELTLPQLLVGVARAISAARVVRPQKTANPLTGYEVEVIRPLPDSRYLASETYEATLNDPALVKVCNDVEAFAWESATKLAAASTTIIDTRGT